MWHLAAGVGFGVAAPVEQDKPVLYGGLGGMVGAVAFGVLAPMEITTERAMMVETSEVVGGLLLGSLAAASFQGGTAGPGLTWGFALAGSGIGAAVGGFVLGEAHAGRHALVRTGALWGLYYADVSFGVVPVRRSAPYGIRYVGGAAIGATSGLLLGRLEPSRGTVNLISAGGAGAAVVAVLVGSGDDSAPKVVGLALAPVVGGGVAALLLSYTPESAPAVQVSPQVDWTTGHRGLRLQGRF